MNRRSRAPVAALTLAALVALAAPATALAAPKKGRMSISFQKVSGAKGMPAVLAGDRFRVRGQLRPGVAGEKVTVRAYYGRKRVYQRIVRVADLGSYARFSIEIKTNKSRSGVLRVEASHLKTKAVGPARAKDKRVRVVGRSVSSPLAVSRLQAGLAALGYAVPGSGTFDAGTARAVLAFRKVNGMSRTSSADTTVFDRVLRGVGGYPVKFPSHGRHVEADLSTQTLALIEGGKARYTYHTSSGAPSTPTITGSFRVYRKDYGTNSLGMVHSAYFQGGYAIHGYHSVPTYNASHGCLRVPLPNAQFIYDWITPGTTVDVYY